MLLVLKLALALKNIAVNLLEILYNPVYALIFVIFLLQIVIEALFQVFECTRESRVLWLNFIETQLQSRNQGSFLLVSKRQLTLFKELLKVTEMLAEIYEIIARVVQGKKMGRNLVNLFNRPNECKQVLFGDFVFVVDGQVLEFGERIRAWCRS